MTDHETTAASLNERLAEKRLPFSAIIIGRRVSIYARKKSSGFNPRTPEWPDAAASNGSFRAAPVTKVHEGKVTEKTDTYFSVGGVTVLKKDMENGSVIIRPVDTNHLERPRT